jgi:hypothetical protein
MSETDENTAAADEAIRRGDGPTILNRESGNLEPGVVVTADPFDEKRTVTLTRWQRDAIKLGRRARDPGRGTEPARRGGRQDRRRRHTGGTVVEQAPAAAGASAGSGPEGR